MFTMMSSVWSNYRKSWADKTLVKINPLELPDWYIMQIFSIEQIKTNS